MVQLVAMPWQSRGPRRGGGGRGAPLLVLILSTLLAVVLINAPGVAAMRESEAGHIDWYLPRVGVPRTDAGSNATTTASANPGKVGLRFHKLTRPGMSRQEKGQTAIYAATESNVLTALNPKNGGVVWRQIFDDDDQILAFWTFHESILVISGRGGSRARLFHALSGHLLWETLQHYPSDGILAASDEEASQLVDADFITYGHDPAVYTLANADTVRRLSLFNGHIVWRWNKPDEDAGVSLARVILAGDLVHVFGLRRFASLRSLLGGSSTSDGSTVIHYVLNAADATLLSRTELSVPAGAGGPKDIAFATTGSGTNLYQYVLWLGRDGAIRSLPLASSNATLVEQESKPPAALVLYARKSGVRFTQLLEVGLREKAVLVGKRADHHAEVIRLIGGVAYPKLSSEWEFEEDAPDAVYSGALDRESKAYVNRVFFQRAQHLLNFHVFWADAEHHGERGQVTGYSFQWDHDLNGNVLAAPFEGSPLSPYQIICRSVFVTSSGSIRMLQEDRHQWMREESLTQIQVAAFVDLPEQKLSTLSPSEAQAAAAGTEGFVRRLRRHLDALQHLPAWLVDFGERFVSGVQEESWNARRDDDDKPKTSTMATAGPRKGQMEEVPGPTSLAPRTLLPNQTAAILRRDPFGFRKVIVAGTAKGKLYALDGAARGRVLWEKSLVGYGPGEGRPEPVVTFHRIIQVRSLGDAAAAAGSRLGGSSGVVKGPILGIVASVGGEGGLSLTRVFYVEALSGRFVDGRETGTALIRGAPRDAFALPVTDASSGQRALGIVGSDSQVVVSPDSPSVLEGFSQLFGKFYYALRFETPDGVHGLEGFTLGAGGVAQQVWKINFGEGEHIVDVISASEDPVASQGKVLGNRKTLYKYLNPHAQLVTTLSAAERTAGVYLLDGVTGKVIFETRVKNVDVGEGVRAVFVENWIVASYVVAGPADPHSQRLLSVEVYEGAADERGLFEWTSTFSSFGRTSRDVGEGRDKDKDKAATASSTTAGGSAGAGADVQVFAQTYIAPWSIRALGTTRTKHGIATKSLLLANDLNQVIALPRRLLDPRRPVGRKPSAEETEELLFTYDALLPFEPKWALSHIFPVAKVDRIVTTPASIESTSLVFAFGLDSYVGRVAPSGAFDILSPSFNKVQLLLTILALAAGIVVTKPLLRSKAINARW